MVVLQLTPDVPNFGAQPSDFSWLNVLGWSMALFVPLFTSAIAGWFAWRSKVGELREKNELEKERLKSESRLETQKLLQDQYTSNREQQKSFYDSVMAEVNTLRTQNTDLRAEVLKLQHQLAVLTNKLEYYEDNPVVHMAREILREVMNTVFVNEAWIHDISNSRWYVNDKYANTFNVNRLSFWHPVNLFARFPANDVAGYVTADMKIVESGVTVIVHEKVRAKVTDPDCEEYVNVTMRKVPIEVDGAGLVFGEVLESLEDTNF